jgi:hypothetical protein
MRKRQCRQGRRRVPDNVTATIKVQSANCVNDRVANGITNNDAGCVHDCVAVQDAGVVLCRV